MRKRPRNGSALIRQLSADAGQEILSEVLNDYDQETVNFYRWKETLSQEKLQQLIADN